MATESLKNAYKWQRQQNPRRPAHLAYMNACADVLNGRARIPSSTNGAGNVTWQPKNPSHAWIENTESAGLRFVGFADDIAKSIKHRGWYRDSFQDETLRGAVYQLPGKNGRARYVAGYQDPDNDGAAFLDMSIIEGERVDSHWDEDSEKKTAAYAADSIAESHAEDEREYNTAWQAGAQYRDQLDSIERNREKLRALLIDRRLARREIGARFAALCEAIETQARAMIESIQESRATMAKLASGDYRELIFYPDELKSAFCDGAGLDAFPG